MLDFEKQVRAAGLSDVQLKSRWAVGSPIHDRTNPFRSNRSSVV